MGDTAQIGINLADNNYYSTEYPFLDRMKTASPWAAWSPVSGSVTVDANGYPLAITGGSSAAVTVVGVDPLSAGTDNTYVLTYSGTASFVFTGAAILSSEPGKMVIQYVNPDGGMLPIYVTGLDPNSPLTDMHLVRSDQQALFASGEIFNPEFTSKISAFDTLRYMEWMNTNQTAVANWADRTMPSSMSWIDSGNSNVPIEVMVALANETKTNMWLNVPTQATDDYVRQMMTYVHDHLDPSLSVSLEYSNEVWNFAFGQSHYAAAQGAALWDTDANGDGVINSNDPAEHNAADWLIYYGYRSAQVASIAQNVFGADDARVHNVISTQTVNQGIESYIFQGVARANLGSVSSLFDDYSITTYSDGLEGLNSTDQATILGWAQSGDAGITAAFAALKDGTGVSVDFSLEGMKAIYAYQASVAANEGLKLVAYEGGLGLLAQLFPDNEQAEVLAFFTKLEADPRIGDLYQQMISDFSAAGGTLLNVYNDARPDSKFGNYGSLKSIYENGSPVWDTLTAAAAAAKALSMPTPPVVTTPVMTPPVVTMPVVTTPVMTTPVVTTPVVTTPVVTTPVVTTPVVTTPVVTTPVVTTPVVTTPVVTTPVVTTPVVTTPVVTTPVVTTPVVTTPVVTTPGVTTPVVTTPVVPTPVVTTPAVTVAATLLAGTTDQSAYTLATGETNIAYVGFGQFTAVGNALDNVITAGDGGSNMSGGAGNDTLIGGAGNDWLDGGTGVDRMVGGAGDDTYVVDDLRDQVIELPGGGNDTVRTSLGTYISPDQVENLTYVGIGPFQAIGNALDNVITGGDGGCRLSGGAGNDTLIAGAGADILDGGIGADRMVGGGGNDIYFVDNAGDQVVEDPNGGIDSVYSSISYTLPVNVENLQLIGVGALGGTGNELANTITGNAGNNHLSGGAGNDTLYGGAGDDVLDGGDGDDTLVGGPGADTLTGAAGADRFVFSVGDLNADPAKSDTITDFSRGDGDKIDLSDYHTASLGSFTFLGTAGFTGHAGDLRLDTSGANQIVYGDINGDGIADFALTVSRGSGALIASDFVL